VQRYEALSSTSAELTEVFDLAAANAEAAATLSAEQAAAAEVAVVAAKAEADGVLSACVGTALSSLVEDVGCMSCARRGRVRG